MKRVLFLPFLALCLFAIGCTTHSPIRTEPAVDLKRFMGDWYVIGGIMTPFENEAYNPVESYAMNEDGTIATTFRFNKGALDGPVKTYQPKGFIRDTESNAIWKMQFIWPFKADYRVIYVEPDYTQTAVGRNRRDYAWIMARTPQIPEADYEALVNLLVEEGYERKKFRKALHGPPGM